MQQAPAAPQYGAFNLWDLYDVEVAQEVPCNRAEVFFHLLYSESTHGACVDGEHTGQGYVGFTIYGPVTDDANGDLELDKHGERKRTEPGTSTKNLSKAEIDGVTRYTGFESMACLKASFKLFDWQVQNRFESEEERDDLVARFRELGLSGRSLDRICQTLKLRRVK